MSVDPLKRVAKISVALSAGALVFGGALAYVTAGGAGLYSVLLGVGLPTIFLGFTVGIALFTRRTSGTALGAVVMASWLAKLILLVIALAILRPHHFYNRAILAAALLGWTIVLLGLEVRTIQRARMLYVEPI